MCIFYYYICININIKHVINSDGYCQPLNLTVHTVGLCYLIQEYLFD